MRREKDGMCFDSVEEYEEWRLARRLRGKYWVSLDLYKRLYAEQGGRCAGCGVEAPLIGKKRLHVDHSHEDSVGIRGLLCAKCNSVLGMAQDNKETLLRLAAYLERKNILPDEIPMRGADEL